MSCWFWLLNKYLTVIATYFNQCPCNDLGNQCLWPELLKQFPHWSPHLYSFFFFFFGSTGVFKHRASHLLFNHSYCLSHSDSLSPLFFPLPITTTTIYYITAAKVVLFRCLPYKFPFHIPQCAIVLSLYICESNDHVCYIFFFISSHLAPFLTQIHLFIYIIYIYSATIMCQVPFWVLGNICRQNKCGPAFKNLQT
jgi:hypothetical protein